MFHLVNGSKQEIFGSAIPCDIWPNKGCRTSQGLSVFSQPSGSQPVFPELAGHALLRQVPFHWTFWFVDLAALKGSHFPNRCPLDLQHSHRSLALPPDSPFQSFSLAKTQHRIVFGRALPALPYATVPTVTVQRIDSLAQFMTIKGTPPQCKKAGQPFSDCERNLYIVAFASTLNKNIHH